MNIIGRVDDGEEFVIEWVFSSLTKITSILVCGLKGPTFCESMIVDLSNGWGSGDNKRGISETTDFRK